MPQGVAKDAIRERTWALLERERVARFPGAPGRVPNFLGAEVAARRLAAADAWATAATVKANPDAPQLPVRAAALGDGKLLYMAVPRLTEPDPFIVVDPARLGVTPRTAASIRGAALNGRPVSVADMPHIDLIVCGTVAVNRDGVRIGKGGGYSDLEYALCVEAGIVDDATVIATTVHPVQVLDEPLPETEHDFRVDLIVTPDEIIRPSERKRPRGIIWSHLDDEKIAAIPVLRDLSGARGGVPPDPRTTRSSGASRRRTPRS